MLNALKANLSRSGQAVGEKNQNRVNLSFLDFASEKKIGQTPFEHWAIVYRELLFIGGQVGSKKISGGTAGRQNLKNVL